MLNITAKALLALVGLTSFGYTAIAAGPGSARAAQTPVILSAMANSNEHTMVISGNYFGTVPPTVRLGDRVLHVESFSPNQLIVMLPPGMQPATYSLTVTANSPYPLTSSMFSAALFATADR
ncbi:MAG: IPT/TIG domain-containing protein [Gammaproteobacteria bacterium]